MIPKAADYDCGMTPTPMMSRKATDYEFGTTPRTTSRQGPAYEFGTTPRTTSRQGPASSRTLLPFALDIDSAKDHKLLVKMNLRNNVAGILWMRVREELLELNLKHQDRLLEMSLEENPHRTRQVSLRKRLSRHGALRVPKGFRDLWPLNLVSWREPSEGSCIEHNELYYDPGNAIYAKAIKEIWPFYEYEWNHMNDETVGDHVEAVLGLFWLHRYHGKDMPDIVHWFIEQFELYVTLVFVLEDMLMFEEILSRSSAL